MSMEIYSSPSVNYMQCVKPSYTSRISNPNVSEEKNTNNNSKFLYATLGALATLGAVVLLKGKGLSKIKALPEYKQNVLNVNYIGKRLMPNHN